MKLIPLSGGNGEGKFVMVDDEDYPVLSRITWALSEHGYARNGYFYMHSLLCGFPERRVVDHIDRNKLNNQKENLRPVTVQRNQMNRASQRNHGTGSLKGVYKRKHKIKRPWQASITKTVDGIQKTHHVGYFDSEEEAGRAYDEKARELFGEYAYLNFPD